MTPKAINAQDAMISAIEPTLKSVGQTLTSWKYTCQKSNEISQICLRFMRMAKDESSALTQCKFISLKAIKAKFNGFLINEQLDCRDNLKWKSLQLMSPQVRRDVLTCRRQAWCSCVIMNNPLEKWLDLA